MMLHAEPGALWDGGCPGSLVCVTQELTHPLLTPRGVRLPLSKIAVGQAAQRPSNCPQSPRGWESWDSIHTSSSQSCPLPHWDNQK